MIGLRRAGSSPLAPPKKALCLLMGHQPPGKDWGGEIQCREESYGMSFELLDGPINEHI